MQLIMLLAAAVFTASLLPAQNTADHKQLPIIDVHVHTRGWNLFDLDPKPSLPDCASPTGFMNSDSRDTEEEKRVFGWTKFPCAEPLIPAKDVADYKKQVLATMERLNIYAVLYGSESDVEAWKAESPKLVIKGASPSRTATGSAKEVELKRLRADFSTKGYKVMGETGNPGDKNMDAYWALAEELDIPVCMHMGTEARGRANIARQGHFKFSEMDPLLLEDVLEKHPKLRVWMAHAGWPEMDHTLAILHANSHVMVDVSGLIWSFPLKEVNYWIQRLIQAGFEDRIMFGSDVGYWPNLIDKSIQIIENADYLSPQERRDILYNNAARWLRLAEITK